MVSVRIGLVYCDNPGDEIYDLTVPAGVSQTHVSGHGRDSKGQNNCDLVVTYTPAP